MSAQPDDLCAGSDDAAPPDTFLRRFGIEVLEMDEASTYVAMSMPIGGDRNPFTGMPTMGALPIMLDAVGGEVNHFRRDVGEWTVTSELALELSPEACDIALSDPHASVVAYGTALGPRGAGSLAVCTLTYGDAVIGGATVRSFYIRPDDVNDEKPFDPLVKTPLTTLADLMDVRVRPAADDVRVLAQGGDPVVLNAIGVINGGVGAAGLELAAVAAVNTGPAPMRTGSLRVNYLRPFYAGGRSRYEATALRMGRGTAVADAHAIGDDGRVAVTARLTAYR